MDLKVPLLKLLRCVCAGAVLGTTPGTAPVAVFWTVTELPGGYEVPAFSFLRRRVARNRTCHSPGTAPEPFPA